MKKALSLFLVVLMLVGMLPMTVFNAGAAELSETMALAASTGTVSGESISWSSGSLSFTANKNTSSNAIRTSDTDHFRLYVGFSATLTCSAGTIKKIEMVATGTSYAIAPTGADGSVGTVSGTTITIVPSESSNTYTIPSISKQTRIKSITVTYEDPNATGCAHTNTETVEAVAATCTTAGNTAGVKCTDCGATVSGNETIEALGHTNDEGVVTAPTCTEKGYTLYTCTVCGSTKKDDYVDATGHNYVDGVCSVCNVEMPTDLDGKYYIAAIRSSGNYQYMTNDLGTASTTRYQIVDSGLTVLPDNITSAVDAQVFELVFDEATATYKIKTGEQYLGWTSGNSGALVDEASAIAATIEHSETEGAYVIHFTDSTGTEPVERYLSLNNNASNAYYAWYKSGQVMDLYLIPVSGDVCTHANTTTNTVAATCTEAGSTTVVCNDCGETVSTEVIEALGHNYVDNVCSRCGAEFEGEIDENDPTEEVKITFELGENKDAAHVDGTSATTYTETVSGYTLNITEGTKMYTGSADALGNGCIKLGTSSVVGGFQFTVPADVREVVICVAKYKANTTKINVNGTEYTLNNASNDGTYDEITVDTSSNKTVILTTVTGGVRAMVNSITYVCGEKDHDCQWDNGVVTTEATCTTDGEMTYSCTVDGCTITKTEKIPATGHSYDADGNCTVCGITPAQVVANAYALEAGASLEGTYTLTGVIRGIDTAYNEEYQNVSVIIDVIGVTDKPILCYRMKGEGADQIGTGDTITVTGTLKNYNGTIEFDSGCTLDSWEDTGAEFVRPETPEEIVNAAYALDVGTTLEGGTYTLTGVITSVRYAYSESYGNITATIQVGEMTDKLIECYRLAGTGADLICVGDTVTVTGNLKNYNGTVQFDQGTTLDSYVINNGHTEVIDAAVEATCTTTGLTEGKHCSVCNLVIVAQEEVAGHTIEHVEAVVPANCQETGHNEYWYCATCDIYYGDAEYSYQLNPAWINYTGEHVRPEGAAVCAVVACTLCGEDSYGETCTRPEGAPVCQDTTCVNCGETIYGWGCNYNTGDEEVPLPLCQPGDCVYCGTHYEKLYDCENGAWAPCLEGECSYGCGAKFPATEAHTVDPCVGGTCETCWTTFEGGHNYVDGACTVCGTPDPDAVVLPDGDATLKFSGGGLSLENDLTVNFVVKPEVFADGNYTNHRVEFKIGDSEEIITVTEYTLNNNKRWQFGCKGISPYMMNEVITATLYGTYEGVEYSFTTTYTAATYCYSQIRKSSNPDSLKKVCVDLLNFGTAHQEYMGVGGAAINGELTEAETALGSSVEPSVSDYTNIKYVEIESPEASFKGATLSLNESVDIRYTVQCDDLTDVYLKLEAGGQTWEIPITVDGVTVKAVDGYTNRYQVYFKGLVACQMREHVKATVYRGDTAISNTALYSIESYVAATLQKDTTSENLKNLIIAMIKYGDSADAYFNT